MTCASSTIPRGIGPGLRPSRMLSRNADLIFLRHDGALELRDVCLGFAESPLGPRRLELRGNAQREAILEQIERVLVGVPAVPGDLELHVESQELEVRLRQVADQRQPHAAPGVFTGQEGRACCLG